MSKRITVEKDRDTWFGYFVVVDGHSEAYAFTLWGAKRIAHRYRNKSVVYEVEEL